MAASTPTSIPRGRSYFTRSWNVCQWEVPGGWTPLDVAASWNLLDIVHEIARHGGSILDWDAKTDDGDSALDLCRNGVLNKDFEDTLMNKSILEPGEAESKEADTAADTDEDIVLGQGLIEQYFDAPGELVSLAHRFGEMAACIGQLSAIVIWIH